MTSLVLGVVGAALKLRTRTIAPINQKRVVLRRLRADLTRTVYAFLQSQVPKIVGQIIVLKGLRKAAIPDQELSMIEAIVAGIDFAGWSILIDEIGGILDDIVRDGTVAAFAQIGIGVEARREVVNVVNQYALEYARQRSAAMVGMRIDELGRVVRNPNAVWQITESTRDYLRADIRAAILEGWSNDRLSQEIAESYGFSKERATVIARTETNKASNAGALEGYKVSGVVGGKRWLTAEDDKVTPECEANGNAGILALSAVFPSGAQAPPQHPNCRCAITPEVDWALVDNIPIQLRS